MSTARLIPDTRDEFFICDNGAIYCGHHLGASAAYTGRDLSGQRVERVTKAELTEAGIPGCESCGVIR